MPLHETFSPCPPTPQAVRQQLHLQRTACVAIQVAWRAHCQRIAYCTARAQVVMLQAGIRGVAARKQANARRAAIVAVQVSVLTRVSCVVFWAGSTQAC